MDWEGCKKSWYVKKVSPDEGLVKSLMLTSKNKFKTALSIKEEEGSYSSIISLLYDSLREILEAIALEKGYKIYNHECYVGFIKIILKEDALSKEFDRLRLARNSINYYAEDLDLSSFKDLKFRIIKIIRKFRNDG